MNTYRPQVGLQKRRNTSAPLSNMTNKEERRPLVERNGKTEEKGDQIHGYKVTPLEQRSAVSRLDVAPFAFLYILLVIFDQTVEDYELLKLIAFPVVLLSHLALVLAQQWRVTIKCAVGYTRAATRDLQKWTHCLVETSPISGKTDADIVTVQHQGAMAIVNFQDLIFRAPSEDPDMHSLFPWKTNTLSSNDALFHKLRYPVDLSLQVYRKWKGHASLPAIKLATDVYGSNSTHIELPPFLDLLGQQLLAPFFLFQLFCVVLWSLDEYWYYAIFTLFALVMFECTVAFNRLKSLQRLRGTLRHPYNVNCFRHNLWTMVRTDELVPGDVISLTNKRSDDLYVPADLLLLHGTAVVDEALLTGESVPQLKAAIDTSSDDTELDLQEHKQAILFGGTMLVSHDGSSSDSSTETNMSSPPDGGIVCMTLQTGFETAQGSLLRSMAHSSMKSVDGIHTTDTFIFVAILLCCAIASATSVLQEGWGDETRNRFRLILHVIIIVTSVVPPELPMELSLAVTNSVADLMRRCHVFCTEPYRIPWAGRVDMCCFDKTGTLTSDEMQLRGVRLFSSGLVNDKLLHPSNDDLPLEAIRVMAGCHALAVTSKKQNGRTMIFAKEVVGDPLEKAVLCDTGYTLRNSNFLVAEDQQSGYPRALMIHHRFAFSSRLKRMTVLITEDSDSTVWAVTKGAPETIKDFLRPDSVPADYDEVYTHHMSLGRRVLGMAYQNFGTQNVAHLKEKGRETIEHDLIFVGFLVLDCPLKPDSKSVITELRKSGHSVVMITGDAVLTAAEVARQVGITKKGGVTYELMPKRDDDGTGDVLSRFHFTPLGSSSEPKEAITLSQSTLHTIVEMATRTSASFCVSGSVLAAIARATVLLDSGEAVTDRLDDNSVLLHPAAQALLQDLAPLISVFARHAPRQKEAVVAAFNLGGLHTLMCGDGTNDVGALKRAHVGISIISAPELEAKHRDATAAISKAKADKKRERKAKKSGKTTKSRRSKTSLQDSLRALQEAQEELDHVELGDASVASPFTSRAMSIRCCKDVLQQGRCTLVTMLQIYKILGVNCLVNALVLTKLHMHGVKQGDRQLTILGIAVAALFLFVTRGKPLPTLSAHRPPSSVLCAQALFSIALQFAVHFTFIMIATDIALAFVDPYDPSIIPDATFNPNVLNTCTFLLTMVATVNTFAVNYRGRPFMEDLKDNKLLLRSVQICYAVMIICALEAFPPLNDLFQLSPFPDTSIMMDASATDDDWVTSVSQAGGLTSFVREVGFPLAMCSFMVVDTILAFTVEKVIVRVFEG